MRRLTVFAIFIFFLANLSAQTYKDTIASMFCDCFNEVDPENYKASEERVALCIFSTFLTYDKEIYRDFKISLDTADDSIIYLFLTSIPKISQMCPKSVDLFAKMITENTTITEKVEIIGNIVKIEKDNFVIFSVLDEKKMTHNVYWMEPVYTNIDLVTEYKNLIGEKLYVDYIEKEFYDPRIEQYRKFKVLQSIQRDNTKVYP